MTKEQQVAHILDVWAANVILHPEHKEQHREKAVSSIMELFKEELPLHVRKENFERSVWAWNFKNKNKYSNECIEAFNTLWTRLAETNKFKFETEKAFKVGGRLATFVKLNKKFEQKKQVQQFRELALSKMNR